MNQKELAINAQTLTHIQAVKKFLNKMIIELLTRGDDHDQTKLKDPELELFVEHTPKLAALEYGSKEYNECLSNLKPALDHHYAKNRHHPEHYPNGIDDMTLVDLVEMVCDWKAASKRHNTGNILKSIEVNTERFKISKQLAKILQNTVEYFDMIK